MSQADYANMIAEIARNQAETSRSIDAIRAEMQRDMAELRSELRALAATLRR
jgi:hypothetical protein